MKYVLFGLIGLLVLILAVGFLLPTTYAIEKEITIDAPSDQVHAFVGELTEWPKWAPWEEQDDSIVTTYGDTTSGVGASQTWTSDSGDGKLELTATDPATGIEYDMAFIMDGTEAPATCAMKYTAEGEATKVTWTMQGDTGDFMPPVIAGYMNLAMKGSIGGMFEQGLGNLKEEVEGAGD